MTTWKLLFGLYLAAPPQHKTRTRSARDHPSRKSCMTSSICYTHQCEPRLTCDTPNLACNPLHHCRPYLHVITCVTCRMSFIASSTTGPACGLVQIRASIKALFPDRDCFPLVRPMSDEKMLAKLETLDSSTFRPEFQQVCPASLLVAACSSNRHAKLLSSRMPPMSGHQGISHSCLFQLGTHSSNQVSPRLSTATRCSEHIKLLQYSLPCF